MANKHIDNEIRSMENRLAGSLHPIKPRAEYRSDLHERLMASEMGAWHGRDPWQGNEQNMGPGTMVLAAIGLTGTLVLLLALIRAIGVSRRRKAQAA